MATTYITYTCEGCGKQFTGTPEEAFDLGWDTPERFMSHCTCPKCPINSTVWWRIVVLKDTNLTDAEARMIHGYTELYNNAVLKNGADV